MCCGRVRPTSTSAGPSRPRSPGSWKDAGVFGLLAPHVLAHWGITRTEDFGRFVFTLVEVGLLVTQPGDQEGDFGGVYDFANAFGDVYEWPGVRGA